MILLLGGTSDTAGIAQALAEHDLGVLVSTASDTPLDVGNHPNISRRSGPLDGPAFEELLRQCSIEAVADATHPYAQQVSKTAREIANTAGLAYLTYVRPSALSPGDDVILAENHKSAAEAAFSFASPVLLTCGANNLLPYVKQSEATGLGLLARVLDREQSLEACRKAGLMQEQIIAGRGPFDLDSNRQHIQQCHAGVIVTKDGGEQSGLRAKLEAAQLEGCSVVVVKRPPLPANGFCTDIEAFVQAICLAATRSSVRANDTDNNGTSNE